MSAGLQVISDLFSEGAEVMLGRKADQPVLVWISKPNPFERQQAISDAQLARARLMLALKEVGSPEYEMFQAQIDEETPDNIRAAIVRSKEQEHYVDAMRDVRSEEDWKERLDVLDGTDVAEVFNRPESDPERKLLQKIQVEYAEAITDLVQEKAAALLHDLSALEDDRVKARYREVWIETRGAGAFSDAMERTTIFLTLRKCEAKETEDGGWDHRECSHLQRVLDAKDDVALLPDGALKLIRGAMQVVNMDPDRARFLEGRGSSSASSPSPEQQEASTASTPDATSAEPVGTSS